MYILEGDSMREQVVSSVRPEIVQRGDSYYFAGQEDEFDYVDYDVDYQLNGNDMEMFEYVTTLDDPDSPVELGYTSRRQFKTIVKAHERTIKEMKQTIKELRRKIEKASDKVGRDIKKRTEMMEDQYRDKMRAQAKRVAELEVMVSNNPNMQVNIVEYNRLKGKEEFFQVAVEKLEKTVAKYKSKSKKYKRSRDKYKKKYKKYKSKYNKSKAKLKAKGVTVAPTRGENTNSTMLIAGVGVAAVLGFMMMKKGKK
ncbi:MAG: hypothetical protein GY793_10320 [Proteobacteria bacterium]|nr:hypothetical protein [Pseudomonadota bacterium]